MKQIKERQPKISEKRPKSSRKKGIPTLDDLVVGDSLPRVKVKLCPARSKSHSRPSDQMVIELQCEV